MSLSIAVLGLGKYGRSLAKNMFELGADVLVADHDPDVVKDFSQNATVAVCADLTDEKELRELGLKNMDVVAVTMGSSLAASIMAVMVAKEEGVPFVLAKSTSQRMTAILKKIGADRVIDPEDESGLRSARILISPTVLDYFDVGGNLCMIEMKPRDKWIGKSIRQLDLRRQHDLNVVAVKEHGGDWAFVDPNREITENTRLLTVMERDKLKHYQ